MLTSSSLQTPFLGRCDRVLLHNISWDQFEHLLTDLGQPRSARLAYDDGSLEIMTPLPEHEYYKEIWGDVIKDIAEVLDQDYACYGSATWRKRAQRAGLEPDNCFYFEHEAVVRGQLEIDLDAAPPPDLALEIDLTSKSLGRLPIYAKLGVPEIWCYDNGLLLIRVLQNGAYQTVEHSLTFPNLPLAELPALIAQHRAGGNRAIRKAVRAWVRQAG